MTPRAITVGSAVLALGLCLVWFALPGNLAGLSAYDGGVYFGVALRLVHGVLPYRDFLFVEPPGIALLLSPLALLSEVIGTPAAFEASRLLTAAVAGANAGMAALLVRHRGRLAMAIAGGGLAVFPYAAPATHTVMLEPYLVLFMLAGLLVAQRTAEPSRWQLLAAGALLGLAGVCKVFAVFPFLGLLAWEAHKVRWRSGWLVVGAAVGFGVPAAPFLVLAPRRFLHLVVLDQLGRGGYNYRAVSLPARLGEVTGLPAVVGSTAADLLSVVVVAGLAVSVAVLLRAHRRAAAAWWPADGLLVTVAGASLLELLVGPGVFNHYTYFTAPLLGGVVAIVAVEVVGSARRSRQLGGPHARRGTVLRVGAAASVVLLGLVMARANLAYAAEPFGGGQLGANGTIIGPGPTIARSIPVGACAVSDDPVLLIEAGRFGSTVRDCPRLVDPFGMWMTADHGTAAVGKPPYPRAVVAQWRHAFARADALVLSTANQLDIPWTPTLERYLRTHFHVVSTLAVATVYLADRPQRR